ncbi:hypothetical protein ALC60_10163, partial [Trachymyrmex zeteki]
SHSLEHYTTRVFQKPPQLDVVHVDHRIGQNTTLKRGVELSPDEGSVVAARVLAANVHETSLQLCLCTRKSRDSHHHGLSVSNDEARTLDTTKFFELLDALVASFSHAKHFSRLAI